MQQVALQYFTASCLQNVTGLTMCTDTLWKMITASHQAMVRYIKEVRNGIHSLNITVHLLLCRSDNPDIM